MRKQLKSARDSRAHVSVRTRDSRVDGYVAAVGRQWCAVVAVDEAHYGGLVLLRTRDVRKVVPRDDALAKRFLQHAGMWPPAVPELLDLDSTSQVLFTAGSLGRTLALTAGGKSRIAAVERIGRSRLTYRSISPKGTWRERSKDLRHARLTRITLWDPAVGTITEIADSRR